MSTPTTPETSIYKEKSALTVSVDLDEILTADELKSFAEQAEKSGRTIREHFIAITIGKTADSAA